MPNDHDPVMPADATVLRPRPGAGKRSGNEVVPPRVVDQATHVHAAPASQTPLASIQPLLNAGLNPLLQAAAGLLLLMGQLRTAVQAMDVAVLRRQVLDEIRRFEEQARALGVTNEIVLAARYALCAALDEAVLATPWGAQSDWSQQTLLVTLHREAWGGEKFFAMLERILPDLPRHIDLIELQYLCIALGFTGKFQVQAQGAARLVDIQQDVYRRIREYRGVGQTELSLRWHGVQDQRNPLLRFVPGWVVAVAALTVLTAVFIFFSARLGTVAAPVEAQLARLGLGDYTAPVVSQPGPNLQELLADDIDQGIVQLETEGGRTLITLTAADLFASASANVNPVYYPNLRHIALALNKVPGRILVTGHTDDQPLRSFRYHDNFELSQQRALSVVEILRLSMTQPGRLESTGVGASEPRYQPASQPQNRARNRRVEILHLAGT